MVGIRAARAELARLKGEAQALSSTSATLGWLLDEWNAHREKSGTAPRTLHEDRRKIDTAIRPALGKITLAKLETWHIDRFYADQLSAGTSPAMVGRYHAILHAALKQAERWGWVSKNAAALTTRPRVYVKQASAPLPAEVLLLVRTAAETRASYMAGVTLFAALSGLRAGELCGLRFSDVDWDRGTVTVSRAVWQAGGKHGVKVPKTHQVRVVAVHELAMAVLSDRWNRYAAAAELAGMDPSDAYVWSHDPLGTTPLRPGAVSSAFGRIRNQAGLKAVRFHDLRHYAGTEMISGGVDPRTAADQLGHANPAITLRLYAHGRPERAREAAAVLGRSLALPEPKSEPVTRDNA